MTSASSLPLRDVALLTRAVENVFRKLIRILIGRMSLKKLQEMIQIIFIEEAEAKLKKEEPGKNVSLTKLGSITDLDTRSLTKIRSSYDSSKPIHMDASFLKGFTPGFKVLDLWINDKKYLTGKNSKPMALNLSGQSPSFEQLVEEAISARGVTAKSMLQRLLENNLVQVNQQTQKIELLRDDYIFLSSDELDMIDIGFSAIASMATTVEHNIENAEDRQARFYQRGCWTYRLSRTNQRDFQKAMLDFLHDVDKKAKDAILPFEEKTELPDQFTAGISMFYFEEQSQN
jgi:predicted transcriptional regulator